ncbi:hypothetical protein R1flu_016689 [Riccia fluitans]|uniref:Uncharacterized protein n=1 Tax=Riccia fluitans TaxID=41844 RepID=A0ABD1YN33_9MARC
MMFTTTPGSLRFKFPVDFGNFCFILILFYHLRVPPRSVFGSFRSRQGSHLQSPELGCRMQALRVFDWRSVEFLRGCSRGIQLF